LGTGPITADAGTLKWTYTTGNGALANNIVVNGPVTFDTSAGNWTQTGPITGSGTVTRGISGVLSLYLGGDDSGFTGTYQDQNNANADTRFTAPTAGSASAHWIFNQPTLGRTSLPTTSGTIRFGSFSGTGTLSDGGTGIMNTVEVGALGLNDTFSGVIGTFGGYIGLTKVGTGTMTFLGANTYTGSNNITAGKLVISTASLANGVYLVASNATFGVTNTTTTSATISNLILAAGSAWEFQRVASPVTPLIAASNLTVNGSCTVKIIGTNGWKIGTNYPLASYAGTFSGQLTNLLLQMPSGYSGTLVRTTNLLMLSVTSTNTPSGLTATPGNNQVTLNWTPVVGATNYYVKRATTSGGPYTTIASSTTASYTDTTVINGTTYYYVVSALSGSGESPNSVEVSAVPMSAVQASLKAYLKFDESSGTTALDSTGNGWNGTLVNGATFVAGYSNNAVNLNSSSNQYVTLPAGVVSTLSNITVTAWVNLTTVSNWNRIFDFGTGTATYMFLTPLPGGATGPRFAFKLNNGAEQQINGTSAVSTGAWHHYAVTLNGRVGILYVDGVPVGTNSSMTINPSSLGNTTQNYIGKSQFGDPYLNGKVDEFRIYGSALSASEVATLVTPLAAPTNLMATAGDSQVALSWNAVASATSYQVFRSPTSGGPYTPVCAVTTTNYTDTPPISSTNYFYVVKAANAVGASANSAEVSATIQIPAPATPTGLAATAGNAQVALTWNASSGATSYNLKRATVNGGPYTTITNVTTTNYLDTAVTNGTTYYYVVSALNGGGESANSSQVVVVLSLNQPLQAYLKFDESSGTSAADATGNGWNGTLVNGTTFVAGYSNNAVNLSSGSSQYVTLPAGVVSTLSNITVAAWVNLATVANWNRIFDFGTGTGTYMFLTPQNGSNGKVRFGITTSGSGGEQQINSSSTLSLNTWHHVAVTINGSVGVMYVDGVAVGTNSAMTLNPASLGNTTLNYIGKSQYSDPYLNGKVDEFRIYSGALSASEVATLVTPLAAPTNLVATAGDGQVTLSWNDVANAANYLVFRSLTNGGPYTPIYAVTTTNYTDTLLLNGTNYFYVVKAANGVGASANSTQVSARPVSTIPPTSSIALIGNQLQLGWPADHTGWRLQMSTNLSTTNWQDVAGTDATNSVSIIPTNSNAFFRLVYP
jgi:autotransporter-associated beta strand protein